MALSPEDIKRLLALPDKKKRTTTGVGGKKVDTTVRDHQTWFKLMHHFFDEETQTMVACENPNCGDPREHKEAPQMCAKVNGVYMCRFCFLSGYQSNPDQLELGDENA